MTVGLVDLCAAHGIEPTYTGFDGVTRSVSEETLAALVSALGIEDADAPSPPTIGDVLGDARPPRCYVPDGLKDARVWGITCQLPSLVSSRNVGMGDFADLAELCRIAAAEGADFVGVNPLNALFWSDPTRNSPFFPSNRRALNPLYIALEWIEGFDGLTEEERKEADAARRSELIDYVAVLRLKDRVLRRLFAHYSWTERTRADFSSFCDGDESVAAHASFEASVEAAAKEADRPLLSDWQAASPEGLAPASFDQARALEYHMWLQWVARRQLDRVAEEARSAGMRVGLYLDCAVGAAPDGSAAWSNPSLTVPQLSIGSPPDPFSAAGQDWALAPLSPVRLAALDGQPLADIMAAVMRGAGAIRIDHAMGLARLWLIPRGALPSQGAYVRYPLSSLLRRLAETSHAARALVIGEDLGLVPDGFRALISSRAIHGYKVFFFERDREAFRDPNHWPADAVACVATHDMPTFAGWWDGIDLDVRQSLGLLQEGIDTARAERAGDKEAMLALLGPDGHRGSVSIRLHQRIATSPCRLAALQLEDALGTTEQVNVPGTVSEYPNWRRSLPVPIEDLSGHPSFAAHTAAMRAARPKQRPP